MGGLIRRGESVTIAAAIWQCDLRDFTAMSNQLPRDEVLAILNDYFDAVTRPVLARGGEILKFIGDSVLAIFPMKDDLDRDDKCRTALTAAEEALEAMRDVNELRASAGKAPLGVGIGLHAGSVSYGNIGSQTRLDFTVIGPAVNLAARITGLCRPLNQRLLASKAFASPCGSKLVPLGHYPLHGFDQPQEVYAAAGGVSATSALRPVRRAHSLPRRRSGTTPPSRRCSAPPLPSDRAAAWSASAG